jgi:hypothetical protein
LPLPLVLSDTIAINGQLLPVTYQTSGAAKAARVHRTFVITMQPLTLRDCRHITASQENLQLLPDLEDSSSIEEAVQLIMRSRPKAIVRRCVSHLQIPPPMWAQLPSDTVINKSLEKLPDILLFPVDGTARCSCGNSDYDGQHPINEGRFIVYGSPTAIELAIETVYCTSCSNTHGRLGPDLGNYSVLNWNNKIGFSHQLLNQYTSLLTHSETPFNAYYHTIEDEYLNNQSPVEFCDDETFEHAWFAFIRLQQIQSSMRCSQCGENPKVVIADGVSISFPSHHRTETLLPPTVHDKDKAWIKLPKTRKQMCCFPGPRALRRSIYDALNTSDSSKRLRKLHLEVEELTTISVCFRKSL